MKNIFAQVKVGATFTFRGREYIKLNKSLENNAQQHSRVALSTFQRTTKVTVPS